MHFSQTRRSARAGLDHAILGGINSEGERADAKRIAQLLRHGAHALGAAEERALAAGADFASEARAAALHHCCTTARILPRIARAVSAWHALHVTLLVPVRPCQRVTLVQARECQNNCRL